MPVPNSIDDLSTTAGSNSPAGSETPKDGDNYLRALSSFIAILRDKLNGTSNTGTVKNGTFSGTMAGAASWAGLQTFLAGLVATTATVDTLTLTNPLTGTSKTAVKTATTSRSSTTTFADDPHLVIALPAGTWSISGFLTFYGTTTGTQSMKLQMAFSGTQTLTNVNFNGYVNTALMNGNYAATVFPDLNIMPTPISTSSASQDYVRIDGVIVVSVAGNLSVQWAQNSSNTNATNMTAGSWLAATKLA